MRIRPIPDIGVKLAECMDCGWVYEVRELRKQRGGLVCPTCYDKPTRVKPKPVRIP